MPVPTPSVWNDQTKSTQCIEMNRITDDGLENV